MSRRMLIASALILAVAAPALAQPPSQDQDKRIRARWDATLAEIAARQGLAVGTAGLTGTEDQKRAVYREVFLRLTTDPALRDVFEPDRKEMDRLIQERTPEAELEYIAKLGDAGAGERGAKSVNAAATNPGAAKLAERSGFTDLIALALDARNVFTADKSAVSVNLNAVALVGLNSTNMSAPAAYRRLDGLRRFGGTVTFGAKVPAGEIIGFSGIPAPDTLFDVFSWDTKVRIVGDRDPRARRWDRVMIGSLGGLTQVAALAITFVPANDRDLLASLLKDVLGLAAADVRNRIGKSLQVSVKAAGQHLTTEPGRNKYSFALLGDQGFGNTDLTFNVMYSTVDDVDLSPETLFTLKTWTGAVGVNTIVARNFIVPGRATELSINLNFEKPVDDGLPVVRKTLWRVVGGVAVPWGDAAKIPVAVTFTNDPNNLKKQEFVTGFIGVSYDFGALKSLFKPAAGGTK